MNISVSSSRTDIRSKLHKPLTSTTVIALGFLIIILVGTLLLMLPISTASGDPASLMTAGFTAVSATCVTGLVIVESGVFWSAFGQTVIIILIQIGGLGFMIMAVLLSLIVRRHISPRDRMLVASSYGINDYGGIMKLVTRILLGTLTIEGIGALLLSIRFIPKYGVLKGIGYSIFHSISAFCNAGFDILGNGNSLGDYVTDPLLNFTIIFLVIIGGIGFPVWNEFITKTRRKKFSIYTRFVLIITAVLIFGGAFIFALLEWNNPDTLGNMSIGEKLLCSLFQSVTWRTAGFATVDNGLMSDGSKLAGLIFMFTGGASGSTAGGVKVATVGIIVITTVAVAAGRKEVNLMHRRVTHEVIMRAMSLVVMQLFLIFIASIICSNVYDAPILDLLYEVVSAGGTVGLTAGLTSHLPNTALVVLMFMMYFGRVGVLTITYSVMRRMNAQTTFLTYPDANILIG